MRGSSWRKDNCSPTLPDGTNLYPISLVLDYRHYLLDIDLAHSLTNQGTMRPPMDFTRRPAAE
jgi:hypothetical protein